MLLASAAITAAMLGGTVQAEAGCSPGPTVGGDVIVCEAATPPNPAGNIDFLGGNDNVTVNSGTYGDFMFGTGTDRLEVNGGSIGIVNQSQGIDAYVMTGGTIVSLDQSGDFDTFVMSGGTISGVFDNGDIATLTGGTIGEVDLNVGNNIFNMSGGTVITNVSAQQNNDTFNLSGGTIGGNVSTGSGTDIVTWSGTLIGGNISLGPGNDTAILRGLSHAIVSGSPLVDGGTGTDRLVFDGTTTTGFGRFVNWENVELTNNTQLTLDGGGMTLGDAGTLTGTLSIDSSSTLFGGGANHAIVAFNGTSPVTVTNAGLIDLANAGASVTDSLTVFGNYVGTGGFLKLNTFLGSDGSPSDKLVVSGTGNSASGSTGIQIVNTGGPGAFTTADGILVVEAVDNATTAPGSFSLAGPAAAGAREYLLFQGGLTGDNPENWYLRSVTVAPTDAPPAPEPLPMSPAPPGITLLQLIRPEVAVHSVVPAAARALNFISIGTFHERKGEQALLRGDPALGTWGRLFGQHMRENFAGGVLPNFDGIIAGLQAGRDVLRFEHPSGHRDRAGVYISHAHAAGDVRGFASGVLNASAGEVRLVSTSAGAYWTHLGPTDGYIDAVVQGSYIDGSPRSDRGVGADVSGFGFAASIEAGQPIPLGAGLTLEPQAQAIWQRISLDDTADQFSAIRYGSNDSWIARVGARLQGSFDAGGRFWQPYIKANVWWNSGGTDVVSFGADAITTERNRGAIGEIGAGITGRANQYFDVYATVSYLAAFNGERRETIKANVGARLVW